jgi:hypothetical protein
MRLRWLARRAGGPSFLNDEYGCPILVAVLSRQGWETTNHYRRL